MNHEDCNPPEIESPNELSDERLKPQIERLRSLRSAWNALAPSCLIAEARKIATMGREVTELLASLSGRSGELEGSDLATADHRLDDFQAVMQELISQVSVSQFRSSLPGLLQTDRQGLLDLLDTMIAGTEGTKRGLDLQIGSIDYLFTLLCTNAGTSGGQIRFDPATLTSRVAALCDSVDAADHARLAEIESEFFAAANMDREDLREEMQQRTLRSRKSELGMAFFVPRILRAIVTYNASLYHRVADEILDSGDWGLIEQGETASADSSAQTESVFSCRSFRAIASAARRRARGEQARPSDEDRIVWALDFDYLDRGELKALREASVGTREDPLGTAILVGLLCRSLAVLSIELQAVEIAPDLISDVWVRELEGVFQEEINQKLSSDAYKAACALSELKNKFLFAPLTDQYREQRGTTSTTSAANPTAPPSEKPVTQPTRTAEVTRATEPPRPKPAKPSTKKSARPESARDLVRSALEDDQASSRHSRPSTHTIDTSLLKKAGLAGLAITLLVSFALSNRNPDLESWSTDQLKSVSPYLERGRRNGEGTGPAFVGRIAEEWGSLPRPARETSATDLVWRLREMGVQQIMIYDRDQRISIQSIGEQQTLVK